MGEPIIRVRDIAGGRIQSPDLDKQEEFLTRFGMIKAERTNDKLFMRGTGASHHIHVTEKGDPGFIALAFRAASEDDLHKLAKEADGASGVEEIDEPGGGKRCRQPTAIAERQGVVDIGHGFAGGRHERLARHRAHGAEQSRIRHPVRAKLALHHIAAGDGKVGHGERVSTVIFEAGPARHRPQDPESDGRAWVRTLAISPIRLLYLALRCI